MTVSIITATFNSSSTIADCIKSVASQTYPHIEHIIIDGGSTDGALDIIKKYSDRIAYWISEPDKGIYDAMNKGIKLASGDIVGILNSDDFYANNDVISSVVKEFEAKNVDSVFADLVFITREEPQKIVRYYNSSHFNPKRFNYGWMPAHPTFFVKRNIYERYGLFKTDYKIASDYELLTRFLAKYKISYSYIPKVIIKMRTGGLSTKSLKSNWILNKEIVRACAENGIKTNIFKVYSKYFTKFLQLLRRP
ncbi:MAG: glycosyltransferase family 2 protein [Bacteroidota bacterium]